METSEFLARHHRRVVDEFIESVLNGMDLGDLERNVLGVVPRREVETEFGPGLTAVQALLHAAYAETLGKGLPEWLDRVSMVLPAEADFLAELGRRADPDGIALLEENAGLLPGRSEVRRVFEVHLWEMVPW